jgi:hypothetical protein
MKERRRHVRAKPTRAMPAHVVRPLTGSSWDIAEALEIVDISVSGLAIALPPNFEAATPGSEMKLRLVIGQATYEIRTCVRWNARGMAGLELVDLSEETSKALRRYVAELLERGG